MIDKKQKKKRTQNDNDRKKYNTNAKKAEENARARMFALTASVPKANRTNIEVVHYYKFITTHTHYLIINLSLSLIFGLVIFYALCILQYSPVQSIQFCFFLPYDYRPERERVCKHNKRKQRNRQSKHEQYS